MRRKLSKVGDVMRIMDLDGGVVYGHYILANSLGPLVRIYICDAEIHQPCDVLNGKRPFDAVACGVNPPVREGRWSIVGRCEIDDPESPQFLSGGDAGPNDQRSWWIVDGTMERRLGPIVPENLRDLEMAVVWSADLLEERIRTGTNLFGYEARMKWHWKPPIGYQPHRR